MMVMSDSKLLTLASEFKQKYDQVQSTINSKIMVRLDDLTDKLDKLDYEEIKTYGAKLDHHDAQFHEFMQIQKIRTKKDLYDVHCEMLGVRNFSI